MITVQNPTLGAVSRCFALVVLVLGIISLATNAAPQKPNAKPGEPCCAITGINTASGVVSAKDNSTGQSFRFFVRDSALLNSLKEGQGVVIDFQTQQVFTSAGANGQGVRLGGILGGSSGSTSFGPVDGARPVGPIDGTRPVGPIDGAKPLGPVDGALPVGPIDGAKPLGPVDGALPAGPIDAAKPLGPVDGARPAGPIDAAKPLGPVDGARPAGPCCSITSINPVTGVVIAKNNSSGQSFQFTVKNSALLGSIKIGQAVFANFSNHQVTLDGKTFAGNITSVGH